MHIPVTGGRDIGAILDALDEMGCVVVQDFLAPSILPGVQRAMREYFDHAPMCNGPFVGTKTQRLGGLFTKAPGLQAVALDPRMLDVADKFLLPNCDSYQVNLTQGIAIHPGEADQYIHRDQGLFDPCRVNGELMFNAMIAVTDFTAANGGTRVVPGSHKWDATREPQPDEILRADMPAGSVLFYLGSLLHSGGANVAQDTRIGAVISFNLGWLRQGENQFLTYSRDEAQTFPRKLQELIGYSVHRPNVGLVNNRDPIELLEFDTIMVHGPEDYLTKQQQALLATVMGAGPGAQTETAGRAHG
jgi:ectoine hydroxylase-related dioxygenase (phytanoyl-CoA dioxygenase family)